MAKYDRSVWREKITLIALAAAASSFIAGLMLPVNQQGSDPGILLSATEKMGHHTLDKSGIDIQALKAQRDEAFIKVFARLEQEAQDRRLTFSAPTQFQGKTFREVKLSSKEKVIALTFDDGPWPKSTLEVLEILKKNNIKATFFMVGKNVKNFPPLARQVAVDGHAIGNHTWSHLYHYFNEAGASSEIDRTSDMIYQTTGIKTTLFRPPGGHLKNGLAAYAHKKNYAVVMWSSDSRDYSRPSVPIFLKQALAGITSGGIVLMHDGGGNRDHTVRALPQLIAEYKKRGYRFVTVPELMEMQDKEVKLAAAAKPAPPKAQPAVPKTE
ncbi:polysaccharide deacetylase family protein [Coleofasciculus sp. H7-2]|uniref:polysaccharide deacetylase family protein n=1 Tax=Coleofasciculus sp. H7-2 TaxID=3351545 RepID=UPI00366FA66D